MKKRELERVRRQMKKAQESFAEVFNTSSDIVRITDCDETREVAAIVGEMARACSDGLLHLRDGLR